MRACLAGGVQRTATRNHRPDGTRSPLLLELLEDVTRAAKIGTRVR